MLVIYLLGVVLAVVLLLLINKWYCERKISDLDGIEVISIIFVSVFSWLGVITIIIMLFILLLFEPFK